MGSKESLGRFVLLDRRIELAWPTTVNVGGVAHHEVEGGSKAGVEGRSPIRETEANSIVHPVALSIPVGDIDRAERSVQSPDATFFDLGGQGDRDASGAGTEVQDLWVCWKIQSERQLDQVLGLWSRDQDPPIYREASAIEFTLAGQVGNRLAGKTACDQPLKGGGGLAVDRRLGKAEEPALIEPGQVAEEEVGLAAGAAGGTAETLGRVPEELSDSQEPPAPSAISWAWKWDARGSMTASIPPARTASSW